MAAVLFDKRDGIQKLVSPVCELSEMRAHLGSHVPVVVSMEAGVQFRVSWGPL